MVAGPMVDSPVCAYIAGEIFAKLRLHCRTGSVALALSRKVGYVLRSNEPGRLSMPDASVVQWSRLPDGRIPQTPFEFAPDLAVFVVVPGQRYYDVEDKIRECLDAETAAVWVANPLGRRIKLCRPDGSGTTYGPADDLPGDPVLPGFRLRVGDVFPPPAAGH